MEKDKRPVLPLRAGFSMQVPEGDTHARQVCDTCGFINYVNPKIVAGCVVEHDGRILLCRRAIEPRRGYWTILAGFMEEHESVEAAARREAQEEACADVVLDRLLAVYSVPRISQVQIIFRGGLATPDFAAGPESLEVALFAFTDIPWDQLAFPSVHWALGHFDAVRGLTAFAPFSNPPGEVGDRLPPAGTGRGA